MTENRKPKWYSFTWRPSRNELLVIAGTIAALAFLILMLQKPTIR
jgi:hypothetical protein